MNLSFRTSRGECTIAVDDTLAGLPSWLERRGVGPVVLVTDTTVDALHGDRLRRWVPVLDTIRLPVGEANKTLATWSWCLDRLLAVPVDRSTTVLAFGGGVVGDLAGFAAATALRGLSLVQVPTTLLAMVDASVGGKVGVDHPNGKNLVGAFHPPLHVHLGLEVLETLPGDEWRSGVGEVIKTALALDAALFASLERSPPTSVTGVKATVEACVAAKVGVVVEDELELGRRRVLNLGHTAAHALERVLGFGTLPHGVAVGLGTLLEARFATRIGVCVDPELVGRVERLLASSGLPTRWPEDVDVPALVDAALLDKKVRADTLWLPLPVRVGEAAVVPLPKRDLPSLFERSG